MVPALSGIVAHGDPRTQHDQVEARCWTAFDDEVRQTCCDGRHGPRGLSSCFDDVFTFERCCGHEVQAQTPKSQLLEMHSEPGVDAHDSPHVGKGASYDASCWNSIDDAVRRDCCDARYGPTGRHICFSEEFPFERCCASSSRTDTILRLTRDPNHGMRDVLHANNDTVSDVSCWHSVDDATQRDCCDVRHGPRGLDACFNNEFTFERCCVGSGVPNPPSAALAKPNTHKSPTSQIRTESLFNHEIPYDAACFDTWYTFNSCCHFDGKTSWCFERKGHFTFVRCCLNFHISFGYVERVTEGITAQDLQISGVLFANVAMRATLDLFDPKAKDLYHEKEYTQYTRSECAETYAKVEAGTYNIIPAFDANSTLIPKVSHTINALSAHLFVPRLSEARDCWRHKTCSAYVTRLDFKDDRSVESSGLFLVTAPSQCSPREVALFMLPLLLSNASQEDRQFILTGAFLRCVHPEDTCMDRGNALSLLSLASLAIPFLPWVLRRVVGRSVAMGRVEFICTQKSNRVRGAGRTSSAVDLVRIMATLNVLDSHGMWPKVNWESKALLNLFFVITVRLLGTAPASVARLAFRLVRKVARQVNVALIFSVLWPLVYTRQSPFFCFDPGDEKCDWSVFAWLGWLMNVLTMHNGEAQTLAFGRCYKDRYTYSWQFLVEMRLFFFLMGLKLLDSFLPKALCLLVMALALSCVLYHWNDTDANYSFYQTSGHLPSAIVLSLTDKLLRDLPSGKHIFENQCLAFLSAVACLGSMAMRANLQTLRVWHYFSFNQSARGMLCTIPSEVLALVFCHFEVHLPNVLEYPIRFLARSSLSIMISHKFFMLLFDNLVDDRWNGSLEISDLGRTTTLCSCLLVVAHFIELVVVEPWEEILMCLKNRHAILVFAAVAYVMLASTVEYTAIDET